MIRNIRENGRRRGAGLVLTLALAVGFVGTWATAAQATTYVFEGTTHLANAATVLGISCVTDDNCVVVGADMARTFNGSSATPIPGLNGPGAVVAHRDQNSWVSVSCLPTGACMMTGLDPGGYTGGSAFRASATAAWTRAVIPVPPGFKAQAGNFAFQSLSCASATFCVEVGTMLTETGTVSADWRWDGKSWHVGALNPDPGGLIHLRGVSCWAAYECLVVGDNQYSIPVRWILDGSTWHRANLPQPSGAAHNDILADAVSCWSADRCMVIGSRGASYEAGIFVWKWSGGSSFPETTVSSPTGTGSVFNSLSCSSAKFCVAAGGHMATFASSPGTYVLLWDGSTWTRLTVHVSNVGAGRQAVASGVSCVAAYTCRLVGSDYSPSQASSFLDSLKAS